jgi:hypothetical protein
MPASADEEWAYWDAKATDLRRTQLSTVQGAATKWATLLTAVLGVFGTVAFAGGLTTLDKLPGALVARGKDNDVTRSSERRIWDLSPIARSGRTEVGDGAEHKC